MADVFTNDLRIREQESGSNAGTWGGLLNTTIRNIASAFGQGSETIPNASTHTITLADGVADEARSMYLKCTGGGQACTVTLAPNDISKVWIIDNETAHTLTFKQGNNSSQLGTEVAIGAGAVKMIVSNGAGVNSVVTDALSGLDASLSGLTVDTTTLVVDATNNRVGVGTNSPATTLHSLGGSGISTVGKFEAGNTQLYIQLSSNGQSDGDSGFIGYDSSKNLTLWTANTERLRIDGATGNVGLGVVPTSKFHVKGGADTIARIEPSNNNGKATLLVSSTGSGDGGVQYNAGNNIMSLFAYSGIRFHVGTGNIDGVYPANERARLDSSGNFLVGCTGIPTGGSSTGFSISDNGGMQQHTHGVSGTGNTYVTIFKNANGTVGGIRVSGSASFFDTSSDRRLKENIVDAPSAAEDIDAIQVRSFNWKADNEYQKYGMIAQELQTVAPEAVSAPEDPDEMMGVDYSKLVPMLVKEIQSLRARVAQLEA